MIAAVALIAAGAAWVEPVTGMEFVRVPAGRFLMGSPASEPGRFDTEGPQHPVSIKAFALAKYPVTTGQFLAFLRATGYQPKPCNPVLGTVWHLEGKGLAFAPDYTDPKDWPAVCLSQSDAHAYIAWLNAMAHRARPGLSGDPYRLPSEAEWEYAARGGTTTARWWGDAIGTGNANCNGCGSAWDDKLLAPVDALKPNAFGLAGMLGNEWEWTEDCWHPSYKDAPADGRAWTAPGCGSFVLRGGAWNNLPVFVRSAARTASGGGGDYSSLAGFRVARNLP